ncbi:MAG: cytochrome c556 [Arenicella sp.]|jgi:cytochrome c556
MILIFRSVLFTIAIALAAGPALAQKKPTPEERAYKFRTSLFQTFAWKLGQMAGAKGANDEIAFSQHATDLAQLSTLIDEGFQIENSLPEGTKAKPEIWQNYEKFQKKAQDLTDAALSFSEAGSMASFDPREFGSKTCGGCHRDFKIKD